MDASVKQRLVGAAVLVVLAVIFLPMVFDGADDTATQTIDLGIPPEPAREFETRVVPLDPAAPSPAAPAPDPNAIVTVDANAPERPDALAGTPDAPAEPVAATPAAPASTAPQETDATPVPSAAATPAAATPAAPAPSATTPPASTRGRYAVSFGSYAKRENAEALVASLGKSGIAARAESVDVNGQPGLRVRAGPFVDRAEAERVRLDARKARPDAPGTVVEIDEAAQADVAAAAVGDRAAGWAVQVGAYQDSADAARQRDQLRKAGYSAYVDTVATERGTMHRVRVGPEAVRANAETLRGALKAKLGLEGMVVAHP